MKIIDLSHTNRPGMPVYPGTEPPQFLRGTTIEKDGFIETKLLMYSHTGTHIDAPSHILKEGASLDRMPADHFIGRALMYDAGDADSHVISADDIARIEASLPGIDFLIVKTGWGRLWGDDAYFRGFPVLSPGAALRLTGFGLKGIGVDAISVDPVGSTDLPVHTILFRHNIIAVENLTNLDALGGAEFIFSCMPLKNLDADGSPVRAFAIVQSWV